MKYVGTREWADREGCTSAWVRLLCGTDRVPGAVKAGRDWRIPVGVTSRDVVPRPLGRPRTINKNGLRTARN